MGKLSSVPERRTAHDHVPSGTGSLRRAFDVADEAIAEIGEHRVELVTVTHVRVSIHPASLADGESIARSLGLDSPPDHRMIDPGYTMWSGVRDGLEFQVRGALRHPLGARP